MFGDSPKSQYNAGQKQRIVERLIVESAKSRGWSPLKTYRAIKAGILKVYPSIMDWDDQWLPYHWVIEDENVLRYSKSPWWQKIIGRNSNRT